MNETYNEYVKNIIAKFLEERYKQAKKLIDEINRQLLEGRKLIDILKDLEGDTNE